MSVPKRYMPRRLEEDNSQMLLLAFFFYSLRLDKSNDYDVRLALINSFNLLGFEFMQYEQRILKIIYLRAINEVVCLSPLKHSIVCIVIITVQFY